ncbi:MAG: hypothetical protein U0939_05390 [Pirellulales bacterium]
MTVDSTLRIGAQVAQSRSGEQVEQRYQSRINEVHEELARCRRLDVRWNAARIIATLSFFPACIAGWYDLVSGWWVLVHGLGMLGIAIWHDHVQELVRVAETLQACYTRQLARRRRQWDAVPLPAPSPDFLQHPIARDLDLFGPRSLFQWLCVAHTIRGRDLLAHWLTEPADLSTLAHRQRLVQALSNEPAWREQLQLHGMLLGTDADAGHQFVAWAAGPSWLANRLWLLAAAWISAGSAIGVAAAWLLGLLAPGAALAAAIGLLTFNLLLSVLYAGKVHDIFNLVAGASDQVGRYLDMLAVAAQLPEHVGAVDAAGGDLRDAARDGIERLSQLRRIVQVADARRGGLLGVVVLAAQLTLLWEFHVLAWLERWQRHHGRHADRWFQSLAELEALASLATAAHDHPDWTLPRIDPACTKLDAQGLGHPLLADDRRVANDVQLGPAGTFLLVTGSNMSGKSTLLRSIGVNVVLGQAGGAVCATRLEFPPVEVRTSMRVADSLADGVSLFFAELLRLKSVVDHCESAKRSGRVLLYLLDEILHGTNSRERQTAVARVLRHLLDHGALGAISTHDLELAAAPEIASACQVVHFRETLGLQNGQRTMSFDYHLRHGISPTTNALVLLEMVGLPT